MTMKERAELLKAINDNLATIRSSVANIKAQIAIIDIALKELAEYEKRLEW